MRDVSCKLNPIRLKKQPYLYAEFNFYIEETIEKFYSFVDPTHNVK